MVARLIQSYMDVGQPGEDCQQGVHGWDPADESQLSRAFEQLVDYHLKHAGLTR